MTGKGGCLAMTGRGYLGMTGRGVPRNDEKGALQ